MSKPSAAQFLISGIVQGVGYRAWTTDVARTLGITGWVRNLHDGRVEVWAEGEAAQLDELETRCRVGPRSAQVTKIERELRTPRGHASFEETRTADTPEPDRE
jgi:acylphosphatase